VVMPVLSETIILLSVTGQQNLAAECSLWVGSH